MSQRYRIRTDKTWSETYRDLARTMRLWGVQQWDAEPNVSLNRANSRSLAPSEAAVTVRFTRGDREVVLTMDSQQSPADNLRALYLAIEDMRMIDVRGVGEVVQSAYLQLAAPATERDPYEVLGLRPGATADEIEAMYRAKAKRAHPDTGGTDEEMATLNTARERVLREIGAAA